VGGEFGRRVSASRSIKGLFGPENDLRHYGEVIRVVRALANPSLPSVRWAIWRPPRTRVSCVRAGSRRDRIRHVGAL